MSFDDALGDGESESGTSTITARRLPKPIKHMREDAGRNPTAGICYREHNILIA